MNRRNLLEWFCRGMASGVAAVVGLPCFQFFVGAGKSSAPQQTSFQRLKRLNDLPIGRPVLAPILGCKQDAWSSGEQQVIGRVWLVRESDAAAPAGATTPVVKAFTTVCPHMGCQIQANAASGGFVCPCHRATFRLDGARQSDPESGDQNHAPRDMDGLEARITQDQQTGDNWVEVRFEKFESGLARQCRRA